MKKVLNTFVMALCLVAMVTMTGCENKAQVNQCMFSIGIAGYSVNGPDATTQAIKTYSSQVQNAYSKALGMGSESSIILEGDFTSLSQQMANAFKAATLPAEPQISEGSYSFTYNLYGCSLAGEDMSFTNQTIIESKTFSNQ